MIRLVGFLSRASSAASKFAPWARTMRLRWRRRCPRPWPVALWSYGRSPATILGGGASRGNARSVASPRLAAAGLNPDALALAVAGRADTRRCPRPTSSGRCNSRPTSGHGLPPIASALLFGVMRVDGSQGEELRQVEIEGTVIAVGNSQMVRQDRHHRGRPYIMVGSTALYSFITDDDAWASEVVRTLRDK